MVVTTFISGAGSSSAWEEAGSATDISTAAIETAVQRLWNGNARVGVCIVSHKIVVGRSPTVFEAEHHMII
ncbi:hypothetical protein [Streptomyces sp. NPDC029674]|uniref:hypothetical protein n=1 Tax=Streptomyces sp. NPDC029674 TaxID=3365297 RepID=UPI0038508B82